MNDEQLTQRIRAASEAAQMSDSAQARHLAAISAALAPADDASDTPVVPLTTGAERRRRIVASLVAAAVMAPAGLAAASDGSVPGDTLYPVKQISERLLVLFDADLIAEHRIEEIEALEAAGRHDADLFDDARTALAELGEDHPLWQRLAAATTRDDDQSSAADDGRSDDEPRTAIVEFALPDGGRATLSIAGSELTDVDVPSGWKVTENDAGHATLESDGYLVEVEVRSDRSVDLEVTARNARHPDDESLDTGKDTTATTGASDDDASSGSETTSSTGTDRDERADDAESAETDTGDSTDDDRSESP